MDNNNIVDIRDGFDLSQTMADNLDDNKIRETFDDSQIKHNLILSLKSPIDSENEQNQLQTTTTINEVLPANFEENNGIQDHRKDPDEKNLIENELFMLLKSHIDSQNKLNQINQSRIRSFERFRKYCQTLTSSELIKFDPEQFRIEYNRLDQNYRYWKKRMRKLHKETKSLMSTRYQNPYDALYELFSKIEIYDQSKDNLSNSKKFEDALSINCNSIVNSRSTKDQCVQCDFKEFADRRPAKFLTKQRRGRPPKNKDTRSQYLSTDPIYPEISINVSEPSESFSKNYRKSLPVNKVLSAEESESSNYSSDSSYDISKDKSVRGRKKTTKTKKSTASKQSAKKGKIARKKAALIKQEGSSDLECPDNPKKKNRGRAKKLMTERKVYHCEYEGCQYSTRISSNMKSHNNIHSNERPFQCDKCEKNYKMKSDLNRHQNIHEGKRFQCTFEGCNLSYSMLKQLQKHIKIVHTKEAPLLHCDWEGCQYSTYRGENLRTHQKIHKGQRTYKCPYCEKAFNAPATLWSHRLKHENIGGFKCDFEGCSFSTHRKASLKNHQLTHFEERLFSCAWPGCGDCFKTASGLASHKMMHENLRRHKCTWEGCDYASNLSSGLKSHIDEVHEKKKRNRTPKRALQNLLVSNLEQDQQIPSGQIANDPAF